jgi:hypothetical protein
MPTRLEDVLGDIQTDRGNLHVDGSPHVIRLRRTTLWHFDAVSGRSRKEPVSDRVKRTLAQASLLKSNKTPVRNL